MHDRAGLIHWLFVGAYFVAAALTMIPVSTASKACLLSYKAFCSFTPISTAILVAGGGLHLYLAVRNRFSGSEGTHP